METTKYKPRAETRNSFLKKRKLRKIENHRNKMAYRNMKEKMETKKPKNKVKNGSTEFSLIDNHTKYK